MLQNKRSFVIIAISSLVVVVLKTRKFIALPTGSHGQYSRSSIFAPFSELHCEQALPSQGKSSGSEGKQVEGRFFSLSTTIKFQFFFV